MKKIIVGLYDKTVYSERFAEFFSHNKNSCLDFRIFTVYEKVLEFAKKKRLDVLLLGQEYLDELTDEKIFGKIIVLSEGNYVMESERFPVIFKYQSVEKIINEVLENIADDENIRLNGKSALEKNTELIGVYSVDGGNAALEYGMELAVRTAKLKRILCVSLEQLNGVDGALIAEKNPGSRKNPYEEDYVRGMSEVIYYLNKNGSNPALKVQSVICSRSGVDFIYPVEDYRDLNYFDIEGMEIFLNIVSQQLEYEAVIFIIGYLSETFVELMQRCDKLYFKAAHGEIDRQRFSSFEKMLKRDGMSGKLDNIMFFDWNTDYGCKENK